MDKLDSMRAFSTVVSLGSFAAAGRQLGLSRSAVSKGVMELEHLLGALKIFFFQLGNIISSPFSITALSCIISTLNGD